MRVKPVTTHEADKNRLRRKKNKSMQTDIVWQSIHRFIFPAIFVLKYKTQSEGSRASEMVHNGSRFWNVVSMDLQKDGRLQLILGRRRSDSR